MPPPTDQGRLVLAGLESAIDAIVAGADYNYTPDAVVVADPPAVPWLDRDRDLIYYISDEDENENQDTMGSVPYRTVIMECFIFGAKTYEPDADDPFQLTGDSRSTVRRKMMSDVRRALGVDHDLGGAAFHAEPTSVRPVVLDVPKGTTAVNARWVAFEMRVEVEYRYDPRAP